MPLTKKQRQILDYLVAYIREHRYSPTYEEIAEHLGCHSLSTVYEHVQNLVAKGVIRFESGKPRSIEVLRTDDRARPYRPVFPPRAWLRERCDDYPVCPMREDGALPLPMIRRYRRDWHAIREQVLADDEIWTFRAPREASGPSPGRAGFAIVRKGSIVDGVLTWDELSESEAC